VLKSQNDILTFAQTVERRGDRISCRHP
jgi:hypothetical protein